MKIVLIILIVIGALATLFVLIKGVVGMAQGKDITGQRSQQLMQKRVMFQAITILLAVALLAVMSNGG
ncbi:HIG1 domain-containing protein [Allosphingosinicella sp.]|uniref:HIG1 domain-containing protein n=1 Tax=Allosphingosinicella sp. TaxID=2823234 RepID=UPI0037833D08